MIKSTKIRHINVGTTMKKIIYGDKKNIIGNNLYLLRKKNGLTQEELAAKLQTYNINIDQQMISKIENNARIVTDYELACLCLILRTDVNEMLQDFYRDLQQ